MSRVYRSPFLTKVIAKIDFSSKNAISTNGFSKSASEMILKEFPILEPKEVIARFIEINDKETKTVNDKQNHLFFHGVDRGKTLSISPDFAYIEYQKYQNYDALKKSFKTMMDALSLDSDFSIKRFGLRYINQVNIKEGKPLDWSKYISEKLLTGIQVAEEDRLIARVFSNLSQNYDDGMLLNFQYGMHNPDFPSRIKQKIFILDMDAYHQTLLQKEVLLDEIDIAHSRIEELFEYSITQDLREKMGIVSE